MIAKVDLRKALNCSRSLLVIMRHSDLEFLILDGVWRATLLLLRVGCSVRL